MKNKDNIKYVFIFIISVLVSGLISVSANSDLFSSNEVIYENNKSGLSSTNVQGAVDELYAAATDYSDIDSRLKRVESSVIAATDSNNNNYSVIDNTQYINLGRNGSSGQPTSIQFLYNNISRGSISYDNSGLTISSSDTNGKAGNGPININGNPVTINGNILS